ncbi:phosphate ABC transporter substrate-binding protein PstS [Rubrimonas cliftonensis]|uniref:Phosphate-binding protein PstS n=1 Tax=Rubrimonas cliftonensis TaxID=89524 RepID=A0A1H4FJX5_9RHOB|nr:phosphate ABC transporter substrate-binding protein PstS [Rubrimonas cliftonensis]SEA97575.1 phosphate ABC transporter substrate-binding protein, PhoT family [Rubrimonas cliftonensis]
MRTPLVLAALALALSAVAAPAQVMVQGAGATFPANLYRAWIDRFNPDHPDIVVSYDSVGSSEGIRRFSAGLVDFGGTEQPMTDEAIAALGHRVLHVPTTAGMVVVAYNVPGVSGALRLSREALARIFAGEITAWNDPAIQAANPDLALPDRTIALVTRRDGSGTTYIFSTFLNSASPAWSTAGFRPGTLVDFPRAMLAPGNEGVSARLAITEYAIGYVEYSFARALGLPAALIENREGDFVAPTEATGRAALAGAASLLPEDGRLIVADAPTGYPIIGYTWALVNPDREAGEGTAALRRFLEWSLTEGQPMADTLGYLSLPEPAAERARDILAALD